MLLRTTAFSLVEAVSYTTDFLAPVIGSSLMLADLSAPFVCSACCFLMAYIPNWALKDPLLAKEGAHGAFDQQDPSTEPLLNHASIENSPENSTSISIHSETEELGKFASLRSMCTTDLALCVGAMFLIALARMCMNFLLLYISRRYHWTTAEVRLGHDLCTRH